MSRLGGYTGKPKHPERSKPTFMFPLHEAYSVINEREKGASFDPKELNNVFYEVPE